MNLVGLIATVLTTFAILSPTESQTLQWERIQPTSSVRPSPRRYSALAWSPTALYVFGGETADGSVLDDTWKYSLFSDTWEHLVNLVERPSARYGFVSGVIGNRWYITHGRNQSNAFDDTWSFSFQDEEWMPVNTSGGVPSSPGSSSTPRTRFFAAGGSPASGSSIGLLWLAMGQNEVGRKLGDSWVLTINETQPNTGEWRLVSAGIGFNQYDPTLPHARSLSAGLAVGEDRFVISGGCASGGQAGGPCPLDDTWLLHRSNGSWEQLTSCSLPRYSSSLTFLHQQLTDIGVVIGGAFRGPGLIPQVSLGGSYPPRELVVVNITSQKWAKVSVSNTTDLPPALSSPHLAAGGPGVFMFGGERVDNNVLTNNIWLLTGTNTGSKQEPCSADVFSLLHLHGIIMYIAWGLLLPFGALLGRYYRWSWPVWFVIHVICQVCGTILTVCGVVLVFLVSTEPSFPHAVIGIILTVIVLQQFLSGIIRPWSQQHDDDSREHYEFPKNQSKLSKWRQCWRVYHGVSGSIAIAIGFAQVTLGVFLIVAPLVVWATWVGLLGVWILIFLLHEIVYYSCVHCCKRT